ncbi:tetratricopeptide repeat protein [Maricaulis sp.]|uniref:tetratricopeptide repeat protein n=1 Tax=Maricaulis sp. TaxID=1486257 RepID=UPI003A8F4F70
MAASLQQIVQMLQRGEAARAETELSAILAANPRDVEALHLRGLARGKTGQYADGIADLEAAAARHPQPHAVLNNLGNLHRRSGRPDLAVASYQRATQSAPGFVDAGFNLGATLAETGQIDEAERAYTAVLAVQPGHAASLNGLGNLAVGQSALERALDWFDKAVAAQPDAAYIRVNRGCLYRTLGRVADALADLDQAVTLAPGFAEAHYQRANSLRNLGRFDAARQGYLNALRCAPLRADIHRDQASLAWEMGEGAGATHWLDQVLQQQADAGLQLVRAEILMRSGQPDEAERAAGLALELDPANARARALRGELRGRLGKREAGLDDLRAAFHSAVSAKDGDATDFSIRHQLVEALLPTGAVDEALGLLDAEPAPAHLQKHVALQSLAWRVKGDGRYRRFYDYDRFTTKRMIATPPGYASLEAFNAALADEIGRLHTSGAQPLDQTLFGGTQSSGRLWDQDSAVIRALADALLEAARSFVAGLPDDPDHPFLRRKGRDLELTGAWSVRLRSGGGHVDHIHPAGWISACYYVAVPETVMAGERAGWLRLGASGVAGLDLPAERYIQPEPGAAIFFPSYVWHGVEPFISDEIRVTAPFDLIPA